MAIYQTATDDRALSNEVIPRLKAAENLLAAALTGQIELNDAAFGAFASLNHALRFLETDINA